MNSDKKAVQNTSAEAPPPNLNLVKAYRTDKKSNDSIFSSFHIKFLAKKVPATVAPPAENNNNNNGPSL